MISANNECYRICDHGGDDECGEQKSCVNGRPPTKVAVDNQILNGFSSLKTPSYTT